MGMSHETHFLQCFLNPMGDDDDWWWCCKTNFAPFKASPNQAMHCSAAQKQCLKTAGDRRIVECSTTIAPVTCLCTLVVKRMYAYTTLHVVVHLTFFTALLEIDSLHFYFHCTAALLICMYTCKAPSHFCCSFTTEMDYLKQVEHNGTILK